MENSPQIKRDACPSGTAHHSGRAAVALEGNSENPTKKHNSKDYRVDSEGERREVEFGDQLDDGISLVFHVDDDALLYMNLQRVVGFVTFAHVAHQQVVNQQSHSFLLCKIFIAG